jgi:hypothetical protein
VKDALALDPEHPEAIKLLKRLEEKAMENKNHAMQLCVLGKHKEALQKISVAIETEPVNPLLAVLVAEADCVAGKAFVIGHHFHCQIHVLAAPCSANDIVVRVAMLIMWVAMLCTMWVASLSLRE